MRDEWYVARRGDDGNKRYGPVPLVQLRELLDSGKVRGEDLVWREGMGAWQRADQCDALAPSAPPRRDNPPDQRGYSRDPRPRDDRPRYDDRPFPRRDAPPPSSGTGWVVGLLIGVGAVVVCLLACGGFLFYGIFSVRSMPPMTAPSPIATKPFMPPIAPPLAVVNGNYGALCNEAVNGGLGHVTNFKTSEMYCTNTVQDFEAQSLGQYLVDQGAIRDDNSISVQVNRLGAVVQVRFCVVDGVAWNDLNAAAYYRNLRSGIASTVFLLDGVEVDLCDANMTTVRTLRAGD